MRILLRVLAIVTLLTLVMPTGPSQEIDSKLTQRSETPAFPLKVSSDKSYLVDQLNNPFLVVGDTAWSMIAQLDRSDTQSYLENRAKLGFNSVIVSLIEHKFSSHPPANRAGLAPFLSTKLFGTPNPAYFDEAHSAIEMASKCGISVWLCPAYLGWGGGDEGFSHEIRNAGRSALREYGRFVGQRFRDLGNIIWMIGGDFAVTPEDRWLGVELALGLREGGAQQLITAHGGQTSGVDTFGDESWLTIDTAYSYKPDLWRTFLEIAQKKPRRPFVLIESTYEGEHDAKPEQIRRQAWWAIVCGGCGQFFGNNPIWHFDGPGLFNVNQTWSQALNNVGSLDIARLGRLLIKEPWFRLRPDLRNELIVEGRGKDVQFVGAAISTDHRYALVYFPSDARRRNKVRLNLQAFNKPLRCNWLNPARDEAEPSTKAFILRESLAEITVLGDNGTGANDWVLRIATDAKN